MKSCAELVADEILELYRANKALFAAAPGTVEVKIGAEDVVTSPAEVIAACKLRHRKVIVEGTWYPSRYSSNSYFIPRKYKLRPSPGCPDIWVVGSLGPSEFPTSAWLVSIVANEDGSYTEIPCRLPSKYDMKELDDALFWFAGLFDYNQDSITYHYLDLNTQPDASSKSGNRRGGAMNSDSINLPIAEWLAGEWISFIVSAYDIYNKVKAGEKLSIGGTPIRGVSDVFCVCLYYGNPQIEVYDANSFPPYMAPFDAQAVYVITTRIAKAAARITGEIDDNLWPKSVRFQINATGLSGGWEDLEPKNERVAEALCWYADVICAKLGKQYEHGHWVAGDEEEQEWLNKLYQNLKGGLQ